MMYPNATNLTAINDTVSFFRMADQASSGVFGGTVSFTIFGLLFLGAYAVSGGEGQRAFVAASFASFVVNLFLVNAGVLNAFVAATPLVILGLSLFVR